MDVRPIASNEIVAVPRKPLLQKDSRFTDFLFGSTAGLVGKIVEFPLDLVKVRLQTTNDVFNGPWDCLKKTVRNEGFRGLYKGLASPLVGSMGENAALFVMYGYNQNVIRKLVGTYDYTPGAIQASLSLPQLALAGAMSGMVASFVLTPVELIKCKLQVQDVESLYGKGRPKVYNGPLDVLKQTFRTDGLRGLYRGHLGCMIRESGGGAAWFGVYEVMTAMFMKRNGVDSKDDLSPWHLVVSGALAGMAFNGSLFPADVIKSRMQTSELTGQVRKGFLSTGRDLFAAEGLRGLYRGLGITLLRSAPASGSIFLTYELLRRNLT
jgi:ornithine carrier protein